MPEFCYTALIPKSPHSHRASYDADGNIILHPSQFQEEVWESHAPEKPNVQKAEEHSSQNVEPRESILVSIRGDVVSSVRGACEESFRQYRVSVRGGTSLGRELLRSSRNGMTVLREFLLQPVWIPGRRNTVKRMSRGTLFVLDVVRFGTTFACIFLLLFLTLNFQSFWQILGSRMEPLEFGTEAASLGGGVNTELREKLKKVPELSVAGLRSGAEIGNLLSYLPDIGPPDNRIIVTKLNLNVPLVTPSYTAMLREDWTQVEQDIQDALQQGVVHYPGTARPGQAGNFFVTGHSSYYPWAPGNFKNVFARLHQLQPGDEYWVYYGGDKHRYVVTEKKEVKPSDITVLDQPTNTRMATLMTCTPVGTTLRRLIVHAQEVDVITGIPLHVGEKGTHIAKPAPKVPLEALPI